MKSLSKALWLGAAITWSSVSIQAADRPNFILIIADDMAWDDCGAYGHPSIRTPNIDALARAGMRFDRAFLTCSSCSPSRSSIITGRYPHNHEVYTNFPPDGGFERFAELGHEAKTVATANDVAAWPEGNESPPSQKPPPPSWISGRSRFVICLIVKTTICVWAIA